LIVHLFCLFVTSLAFAGLGLSSCLLVVAFDVCWFWLVRFTLDCGFYAVLFACCYLLVCCFVLIVLLSSFIVVFVFELFALVVGCGGLLFCLGLRFVERLWFDTCVCLWCVVVLFCCLCLVFVWLLVSFVCLGV